MARYPGLLMNPNIAPRAVNIRQAKEAPLLAQFQGGTQAARIPAPRPIQVAADNSLGQGLSQLGKSLSDIGKMNRDKAAAESLSSMYVPAAQVTEDMTGPEAMASTPTANQLMQFGFKNINTPAGKQALIQAQNLANIDANRATRAFELNKFNIQEANKKEIQGMKDKTGLEKERIKAGGKANELSTPKMNARFSTLAQIGLKRGYFTQEEETEMKTLQFLLEREGPMTVVQTERGPEMRQQPGKKFPPELTALYGKRGPGSSTNQPPAAAIVPQAGNNVPSQFVGADFTGVQPNAVPSQFVNNNAQQAIAAPAPGGTVQGQAVSAQQTPQVEQAPKSLDAQIDGLADKVTTLTGGLKQDYSQAQVDVKTNNEILRVIDRMIELSPNAYSGALTGAKESIASFGAEAMKLFDPDFTMPELAATEEYNNLLARIGLKSVRELVGGSPGEREVLLIKDLQGSLNLTQDARDKLLQRTREAAIRNRDQGKRKTINILSGKPYATVTSGEKPITDYTEKDIMKMSKEEVTKLGANIGDLSPSQAIALRKKINMFIRANRGRK